MGNETIETIYGLSLSEAAVIRSWTSGAQDYMGRYSLAHAVFLGFDLMGAIDRLEKTDHHINMGQFILAYEAIHFIEKMSEIKHRKEEMKTWEVVSQAEIEKRFAHLE